MQYNLAINEPLSVRTEYVGHERQPVLILDDYLRDPEAMVRFAVANQAHFKPSPVAYPGLIAPVPEEYLQDLVRVLGPLIGDTFAVKAETVYLQSCLFAIATFPPEKLHFRQRLPHVDHVDPGRIALVHYLCNQGGTALFRHRATGYETLTQAKNDHMINLITPEIAQNPLAARYPDANTPLFEQTAYFQATYNRVIAYRSQNLHSMALDANTRLSPDPRIGRLTVNTFLVFESV